MAIRPRIEPVWAPPPSPSAGTTSAWRNSSGSPAGSAAARSSTASRRAQHPAGPPVEPRLGRLQPEAEAGAPGVGADPARWPRRAGAARRELPARPAPRRAARPAARPRPRPAGRRAPKAFPPRRSRTGSGVLTTPPRPASAIRAASGPRRPSLSTSELHHEQVRSEPQPVRGRLLSGRETQPQVRSKEVRRLRGPRAREAEEVRREAVQLHPQRRWPGGLGHPRVGEGDRQPERPLERSRPPHGGGERQVHPTNRSRRW